jgi:hypothetical protein
MFEAAFFGNVEELRFLVTFRGGDVNRAQENGLTPLMIAASRGYKPLMRSLCRELGADVNQHGLDGKSALCCAMKAGRLGVVKCLIQELGADPVHSGQHLKTVPVNYENFYVEQYVRGVLIAQQFERRSEEIEQQQRNKEYEKEKGKERKRAEQGAANEAARLAQQEDNSVGESVEQQLKVQERQEARKHNVTSKEAPPVAATITDALTLQQKAQGGQAAQSQPILQVRATELATAIANASICQPVEPPLQPQPTPELKECTRLLEEALVREKSASQRERNLYLRIGHLTDQAAKNSDAILAYAREQLNAREQIAKVDQMTAALRQQTEQCQRLEKELASAQEAPKWESAAEQLPRMEDAELSELETSVREQRRRRERERERLEIRLAMRAEMEEEQVTPL